MKTDPTDIENFVELEMSPLEALLKIKTQLPQYIESENVYQLLSEKGIKFGIDDDNILKLVRDKPKEPVCVATGVPPVAGTDARIEEIVKIDATSKPLMLQNGRMDYRSIDNYRMVNNGETIAVKHPVREGHDGRSIFGEKIPAKMGKDVSLIGGENTILSPDKLKVIAGASGYLFRTMSSINVGTTLVIKNDVDMTTGHIKYQGDLVVQGNVRPGFKVEATGNILIFGEVENATIWSREGSIEIRKGMFGKQTGSVFAKNDIMIDFAQETKITAEKTVRFKKYLMNCDTLGENGVISRAPESYIVGGTTRSHKCIVANQIGNDSETGTRLELQSRENRLALEKIEQYKLLSGKLNKKVNSLSANLKQANQKLLSMEKPSPGIKKHVRELIAGYKNVLLELRSIQGKISLLEGDIQSQNSLGGYVTAALIYPKVLLVFERNIHPILKLTKKAHFSFENGLIKG